LNIHTACASVFAATYTVCNYGYVVNSEEISPIIEISLVSGFKLTLH